MKKREVDWLYVGAWILTGMLLAAGLTGVCGCAQSTQRLPQDLAQKADEIGPQAFRHAAVQRQRSAADRYHDPNRRHPPPQVLLAALFRSRRRRFVTHSCPSAVSPWRRTSGGKTPSRFVLYSWVRRRTMSFRLCTTPDTPSIAARL